MAERTFRVNFFGFRPDRDGRRHDCHQASPTVSAPDEGIAIARGVRRFSELSGVETWDPRADHAATATLPVRHAAPAGHNNAHHRHQGGDHASRD
jgi:hypothetical protein